MKVYDPILAVFLVVSIPRDPVKPAGTLWACGEGSGLVALS